MFLRKKTWYEHKNPDGSIGGNVPRSARIGKNVTIAKTAIIMPGAVVPDNTTINSGEIFTTDGLLKFDREDFVLETFKCPA